MSFKVHTSQSELLKRCNPLYVLARISCNQEVTKTISTIIPTNNRNLIVINSFQWMLYNL